MGDSLGWRCGGAGYYDGTARVPDYRFSVGPEHIYVTVGDYEMDIWVMDVEVER